MPDLNAVITGVHGGIGCACAEIFLQNGWRVLGLDIQEKGRDQKPFGDHPHFKFIRCDVSDESEYDQIVEQIIAFTAGKVHALVNNAAIQIVKPLAECHVSEFDKIMGVNVRAPLFLAIRLIPLMQANEGPSTSIVNISSVHALATSPSIGLYAASKGALLAVTRSMAIEFASKGIRVNAVLPGAVDTGMLRAGLSRNDTSGSQASSSGASKTIFGKLELLASKTVLGRIGKPSEIAEMIYFLATEKASFITGQSLTVDGGAIAKLSTE